jgi:hypothetical protein
MTIERQTIVIRKNDKMVRGIVLGLLGWMAVAAAEDSMPFGSTELRLGMSKGDVAARLLDYKVNKLDGDDFWLVGEHRGGRYRSLGSLGFRNDRLCIVTRQWASDADDAEGIMRSVIAALREQGEGLAQFSEGRHQSPGTTLDEISIVFLRTGRTVYLSLGEQAGYSSSASVSERMGSCSDRSNSKRRRK